MHFRRFSLLVGATAAVVGLALAAVRTYTATTAHEACQTGCSAVLVACYATGGFSFRASQRASLAPPPSMLGAICDTAIGSCLAACTAATRVMENAS